MTIHTLSATPAKRQKQQTRLCEHRTVSKEGRIVCRKIVEGEGEVSPNVCRACPARAVNCA
ncbi:MAG: hypothetical protein PVH17_11665, partial [Anaerolineae bacterium]